MAKRKAAIKVGVIGYGGAFNMGKAHLEDMRKAGMVPTAVAEINPERLKVAAQEFPDIQTYASVGEMLRKSDVELLAVITPHNTHARLAIQCLMAGRHVVVEKPFAITTAQCDAMIAAARKHKRLLSTFPNRHWDGCILQANKALASGALGEVFRVEAMMGAWGRPRDWWRSSKSISGGILYDWGVHLLEYTFQILRAPITEVAGYAKKGFWADKTPWKADTNEDEGCVHVRYKDGSWSTLCISSLEHRQRQGWVTITGTLGGYSFDYNTFEMITHKGEHTIQTRGRNMPSRHASFYQNIADHLMKGEKLVITPEWARRPVHVLDLACQSAAKGRALPAKYC